MRAVGYNPLQPNVSGSSYCVQDTQDSARASADCAPRQPRWKPGCYMIPQVPSRALPPSYHTFLSEFSWHPGARGSCHFIPLSVTRTTRVASPSHSFSHPQLSSPLSTLFSSCQTHFVLPGPQPTNHSLCWPWHLSLGSEERKFYPDAALRLPHGLSHVLIFKVSLTFRQVKCWALRPKAEAGRSPHCFPAPVPPPLPT